MSRYDVPNMERRQGKSENISQIPVLSSEIRSQGFLNIIVKLFDYFTTLYLLMLLY
jgi:hypothetical protein